MEGPLYQTGLKFFRNRGKKMSISLAVVLIGFLAYTSTLENLLQHTPIHDLDQKGDRYYEASISRAIYTFAMVRGLNGVISVIQGTAVAVSPAGVGLNLAVGEILDPANDLVERFSWVMLISTSSLGIQKILMEMGAWFGFTVLLSLSMLLILLGIWTPRRIPIHFSSFGYKMLLIAIIIRFGIPAVALFSETLYDLFLAERYARSITSLEKVDKEIKDTGLLEAENEDPGYLELLKDIYRSAGEKEGIKEKILLLKDKISDYAEYIVDLIIVFVIQTVMIPLVVLWGLIRLVRYIFGSPRLFSGKGGI